MVLELKTPVRDYHIKSQEKSFKAKAPNVYKYKFYMDCYNSIQQYKDHFAMSSAQKNSQVFYTAIFLKE